MFYDPANVHRERVMSNFVCKMSSLDSALEKNILYISAFSCSSHVYSIGNYRSQIVTTMGDLIYAYNHVLFSYFTQFISKRIKGNSFSLGVLVGLVFIK